MTTISNTPTENKGMILIVDDISKNIEVLGGILKEHNYSISVAMSGKQALSILAKIKPDLILLDIQMPEMDGFEVCKKIKSDPATAMIPIIFLTARTETEDIIKGFEAGAVDYITKPFNQFELLARVKTHIDLKKSRDLIIEQAEKLKSLNTSKDKLFSVIAHDLRGPIGNLLSSLELMTIDEDFLKTSIEDNFIYDLKSATESVYFLLDNLLNWAKSQLKAEKLNIEENDLSALLNEICSIFQPLTQKKKITLEKNYSPDLKAKFDKETMGIIIRNLLSNAVKFSNPDSSIKIFVEDKEDKLNLIIEDNGIGIKEDILDKLFVIKEDYQSRGTANEKGSGLGLVLVYEFVKKNGGDIFVDSAPGKGTKVTVSLNK